MFKWRRASWTEAIGCGLFSTTLPVTLLFAWLDFGSPFTVGLVTINALFLALWLYGIVVTKRLRNIRKL